MHCHIVMHCLGLPYWHYQLVLTWYLHQPESHQLSLQQPLGFSRKNMDPIKAKPYIESWRTMTTTMRKGPSQWCCEEKLAETTWKGDIVHFQEWTTPRMKTLYNETISVIGLSGQLNQSNQTDHTNWVWEDTSLTWSPDPTFLRSCQYFQTAKKQSNVCLSKI